MRELAQEADCTLAQLSIAWVLAQKRFIHAIPGSTSTSHIEENLKASDIIVESDILKRASEIVDVCGPRYPAGTQAEIDTEEYEST